MDSAQLGSLTAIENVVNEYAKTKCKAYGINPDKVQINLVMEMNQQMGIVRGPVVNVYLLWPAAKAELNTFLDDAFKTIKRQNMIDSVAIESAMIVQKNKDNHTSFKKEVFGDLAEVISDLVPLGRLQVTRTVTVTVTDITTGCALSYEETEKAERFNGRNVKIWLQLSRLVRAKLYDITGKGE